MVLHLPPTFEEYWGQVGKDIRTQTRKAQRNGYTARWGVELTPIDIAEIWASWDGKVKQGRTLSKTICHFDGELRFFALEDRWPYTYYPETQGYLDMIRVYNEDGLVIAYLELASDGDESLVFSTLGHYDYLDKGVMKLLFVETVKGLIARGGKNLYYMKDWYIKQYPERSHFVNDLGFKYGESHA